MYLKAVSSRTVAICSIYINDLPECVRSDSGLFADDAKIHREVTSSVNRDLFVQEDLGNLSNWSRNWQLGFQPPKCKHLPIGHDPSYQYEMCDMGGNKSQLQVVTTEKDLGIIIDSNLNFKKHIDDITNRANKVLFTIKRTLTYKNEKTVLLLYKALVRPILEYAQEVWHPVLLQDIDRIEKIQRRATKLIPSIKHLSYEDRLRHLKLPSLVYRRKRGDMLTTYKIMHGLLVSNISLVRNTCTNERTLHSEI